MTDTPTNSKFYAPCLEVLKTCAPAPMGVTGVIKAVNTMYPDLHWASCSGGVRAMLLKMAAMSASPICQVESVVPPLFFVKTTINFLSNMEMPAKPVKMNVKLKSMFFKPCCEILKACYPNPMSPSALTKAIIERYSDLEWSHSQGPVRAMLLSAAKKEHCPIRQKEGCRPPQFFYEAKSSSEDIVVEASAEEIMGNAYAQTLNILKEKLKEKILAMDETAFEHLANKLIGKMILGDPKNTPPSGDGGIDGYIHIYEDPLGLNIIGVQAKHYTTSNVQAPDIDKFIGALNGKSGVFVTCSSYSVGAQKRAEQSKFSKVVLVGCDQLVDFMIRYNVGVKDTGITYNLAEVDIDFFDEL